MADLCAFTTGNKMQCEMRDELKRLHRVIANRKREILVAAVLEKEKEEEGSNGKREKIGGITRFSRESTRTAYRILHYGV